MREKILFLVGAVGEYCEIYAGETRTFSFLFFTPMSRAVQFIHRKLVGLPPVSAQP
jgi:hypothetical protein